MCCALALWNERDSILKERLFGLTNNQGNHGEDVKELYYYLDNNPQHTYMKALYKYPHNEFPYQQLVAENANRGLNDPEFEILDTGVFQNEEYFDVYVEYAQTVEKHLVCRVTVINRSSQDKSLVVVPQMWFRNTWSPETVNHFMDKPSMKQMEDRVIAEYNKGRFSINFCEDPMKPNVLFTENETRPDADLAGGGGFYKDAFHKYIIQGEQGAVNTQCTGTKCCGVYNLLIPGGAEACVCWSVGPDTGGGKHWDSQQINKLFKHRLFETNKFFRYLLPRSWSEEEQNVARQAVAGLLWSKQFYIYDVAATLSEIELVQEKDSIKTKESRNSWWRHLRNCDVISMPDKWEFPWYASWDLAFHMIPFLRFDKKFVKYQLSTLLLNRYMKPDGQLPGCEFNLDDPNPPLHAWACLKAFCAEDSSDLNFLRSCFDRLLLNFNWWTSFSDYASEQRYYGFLGMDNISVVNRSEAPPTGCRLLQADASGWMAFFALHMLKIFLILAASDESISFDLAEKFLNVFLIKARELNQDIGNSDPGHWDERSDFYYDVMLAPGGNQAIKIKSLVGIVPLFPCGVIKCSRTAKSRKFHINLCDSANVQFIRKLSIREYLLMAVPLPKMQAVFKTLFSESEFLSPYGIRSLSKVYEDEPYSVTVNDTELGIQYTPGETQDIMFGGNSNWRGPIWLCMNYLIVQSLEHIQEALGDKFKVVYPAGSGVKHTLTFIIKDISKRIVSLFLSNEANVRPLHGSDDCYAVDPHWKPLVLFYEFFHAETGRGCGASHQTGWTSLVLEFLHKLHGTD
ncbi:uncharacterized protein YMR196W-like isoform X2 [Gigantopelta aegis]|nr:uncharacterized protein YMR196W-like isoform X2 [Gigantopelta aegis]